MLPSPWLDVAANLFSAIGTVGAFAVAMYRYDIPKDQEPQDMD